MKINDITHPIIQQALSLSDRRIRDRTGLFFSEGARFLIQAAQHNAVEHVIITPEALAGSIARSVQVLRRRNIPVSTVDTTVVHRITSSTEPSGIGVIARQHWNSLPSPQGLTTGCWMLFDEIRSPGNLGSILRTCSATAMTGVIFTNSEVDPYSPGCVRGSMGSIFSQRLIRASWRDLTRWSKSARVPIIGTSPHAERDFREVSYRRPVVLMMGCEREGLSAQSLAACDSVVRIPMAEGLDSLNVAAAAAILLYEVFGQREEPIVRD